MKSWERNDFFGSPKIFFPKKFEFSKLIYSILGPFLRDEKNHQFLEPKIFFQKVWISKVDLLYFRIISEGWNPEKKLKIFRRFFSFLETVWIFKLVLLYFRTISERWNHEKKCDKSVEKWCKIVFLKKSEFSNWFYSILGPFLSDEIRKKCEENRSKNDKK